jgi:hypothetical protein
VVVTQYNFAMLCTVARTILTQKFPSHEKQLGTLFNQCRELSDDRNRIVHGHWWVTDKTRGLHYVARTLSETVHFEDRDKLRELTELAARLHQRADPTLGRPGGRCGLRASNLRDRLSAGVMVRPHSAALSAGTSAVLGREQPAAAGRMVPGVPRKAVMWRTDRRKMGADCLSYLKQTRSKPMSVSASDGAEKLSTLAEELSGNDPELGAKMLLLAAAALAESRATYLEAAREAFEIARKPVD